MLAAEPENPWFYYEAFPLYAFINPPKYVVHENFDRLRRYEDLEVCGMDWDDLVYHIWAWGHGAKKDNECFEDVDCDKKQVDLCHKGTSDIARTENANGSCGRNTYQEEHGLPGRCSYRGIPKVAGKLTATDFSSSLELNLIFPKYQSGAYAYDYIGSDNTITWGAHNLGLTFCDQVERQMSVLVKADQTKKTFETTSTWPIGWVDYDFATTNGKTLAQIYNEIPSAVIADSTTLVQARDQYLISLGKIVENTSSTYRNLCQTFQDNLKSDWVQDVLQSPLYPPSVRRGYGRGSICVWNLCYPNPEIEASLPNRGTSWVYYMNASIHQTFAAALDSLFLTYPLDQALEVYKQITTDNPALRYALVATKDGVPETIYKTLLAKGYKTYGPGDFLLPNIGHIYDYQSLMNAHGYKIQPILTKETAGAIVPFSVNIIDLFYYKIIDSSDDIKRHLITIPDLMGQSIYDLQEAVYETRDTAIELEDPHRTTVSNIVDNTNADHFYGGEGLIVADAQRRLAYYPCDDPMYSNPKLTNIEKYAFGEHIGCFDTTEVPEGKCDGQLFAKLLEGSNYQETSVKGTDYFNANIKGMLTPELMNTYAAAEKETGIPCEILAGIHFVEADNNPEGSLVSGRPIGGPEPDAGGKVFRSLMETAVYAGNELKGKVGGNFTDVKSAITALSRYNGGGNSNCQAGYPYPIPYGGCPRAFEGEDDPYPTSFLDGKHDTMYLLYCADYTACAPQVFERPGSFTVALNVYNSMTKNGYENSDLPKTQPRPPTTPPTTKTTSSSSGGFFPKSCGEGSLSTALGCLPFTRDAFVTTLLSFIIGISGGIALIVMLIGTIQIMTAAGDPKKLQSGRDLFTAAVAGLLFLIFSVSLLRLIAGNIIKLPGFGG
ncbi:MAG: hypothetical protein ABII21_03865 [bacterium]